MIRRKRTKIVCTIGPASEKPKTLEAMIRAGMNVARLNFSHGSYANHKALMNRIRVAAKRTGEPVAILQDLQGPKVRVGALPEGGVKLVRGSEMIFTTGETNDVHKKIPVAYTGLHKDVKTGDRLLLDDGLLEVRVESVRGRDITCRVVVGGTLTSHKGINVPTASLNIPAITEKDKKDVLFGLGEGVDFVALSFVKNAGEVKALKKIIADYFKKSGRGKETLPQVIVKIEKHEAITNFDAILAEADGIMVARGDLGIETPAENVPVLQKMIVDKTRRAGKPVIVATQMLDSMIRNPRPTRAEVSDVANAVIDHADAVMLSGESATGAYPIEAVQVMARTIMETEASGLDDVPFTCDTAETHKAEAMTNAAVMLANQLRANFLLVASYSGRTGRLVARHRPILPVVVATDSDRAVRQLNLSWGIIPLKITVPHHMRSFIPAAVKALKEMVFYKKKGMFVAVGSGSEGKDESVNILEIQDI